MVPAEGYEKVAVFGFCIACFFREFDNASHSYIWGKARVPVQIYIILCILLRCALFFVSGESCIGGTDVGSVLGRMLVQVLPGTCSDCSFCRLCDMSSLSRNQ